MSYCTNCGTKQDGNKKFCKSCGKMISPKLTKIQTIQTSERKLDNMNVCISCGTELSDNEKFCTKCGKIANQDPMQLEDVYKTEQLYQPQIPKQNVTEPKVKRNSMKRWQIATLITLVVFGALVGVFFKQIKGGYNIVRYSTEKNSEKKFQYACEALKNWKVGFTVNAFETAASQLIDQKDTSIESEILEYKDYIKPENFKELSKKLYNQKTLNFVEAKKYNDAFDSLIKYQENGGIVKDNPKYEIIMLNIIADVTNTKVYDTKVELKEKANTYFDNFDEDPFDEIIQIKDLNPNEYSSKQYDINLYKLTSNKYEKVYTQNEEYSTFISGDVYNYDKDKKGLYLQRVFSGYVSSCEVYKVKDNKFESLGSIGSSDPCKVEDFDNDGIYEVKTSTINDSNGNYSHADAPRIEGYYKFKDDGNNNPILVKEENTQGGFTFDSIPASSDNTKITDTMANADFILPDSDKRYLTEAEVSTLSKDKLALGRNEIFARHGFVFKNQVYAQYFTSKSWYSPNSSYDGGESLLNEYEKANCILIKKFEE